MVGKRNTSPELYTYHLSSRLQNCSPCPGRWHRLRGYAPQTLSRATADAGTVTSALVPWNSCGAYMSAVLGVPTILYLPFCVFNIMSPILTVLYGFTGFKITSV